MRRGVNQFPSRSREGLGVGVSFLIAQLAHPPAPSRKREGELAAGSEEAIA